MDEGQLPRRPPGRLQPPRHCTGCRQPFVAAGTRVVRLRGTLHAFDRCAGCGRESGRPATAEEWRHLGYIKPAHVKGMGMPHPVGTEDESLWDWSDDQEDEAEDDEQAWRTGERVLPGWVIAGGLMLAGAAVAMVSAWADSRPPADDEIERDRIRLKG